MHKLSDYDYILPEALIAQELASPPDGCKLLVYKKKEWLIEDRIFHELPEIVPSNSLLVFNSSKVLKARLLFGDYEIFYLHSLDQYRFNCMIWMTIPNVKVGKRFKVWMIVERPWTDITFTVESISYEGRILVCNKPILEVVEQYGQMPFPPYIEYTDEKADTYQPLFAKQAGSVAAPTASLHFTDRILENLSKHNIVTAECVLHVWLATFRQVETENIKEYDIHSESIIVNAELFEIIAMKRINKELVVWVWTTVTRTLETLPYIWSQFSDKEKAIFTDDTMHWRDSICVWITRTQSDQYVRRWSRIDENTISADSTLYIYPWFTFRVITGLLTNFHVPKSTLLMLVSWFMWYYEMKKVYDHAINTPYKFFSFGDAMLILPE